MFAFVLAAAVAATPADPCAYDRRKTLALDEQSFDQDLNGGWRVLEDKPQCELVAADLVRDYRNLHRGPMDWSLFWHEGQLRAGAGQTRAAIRLFEQARRPGMQTSWNLYVDGTIAFLRHDRTALQTVRDKLAALPRPADLKPLVFKGQSIAAPWPPNLNVLDGFIRCFNRSYDEAYGPRCTKPAMQVHVPAH